MCILLYFSQLLCIWIWSIVEHICSNRREREGGRLTMQCNVILPLNVCDAMPWYCSIALYTIVQYHTILYYNVLEYKCITFHNTKYSSMQLNEGVDHSLPANIQFGCKWSAVGTRHNIHHHHHHDWHDWHNNRHHHWHHHRHHQVVRCK